MPTYEVDPLVSIRLDDVVNTFYPSRIDNTKLMIGGQNSFEVFSIDSEWKYKNEQIRSVNRSKEPYPILQMKPHPMYTMATANAKGTVLIWDFDYGKRIKSFAPVGNHGSMCQGLSWSLFNPNLLLSCAQDGNIYLWDRRDRTKAAWWEYQSGAAGFSYVKFDPFHENLFSCIHDLTSIKLFDMSMPQKTLFNYTSETNSWLNTIHYNPYKPNIMAVGCDDRSIRLFSTQNNELTNLYSSFYHNTDDSESNTPPPTAIETDFKVRDISWNPQNPNVLAACGIGDCDSIGMWDIRRPHLPYRVLHQTQRVKEISWTTHPGSSSSEYLAILQDGQKPSSIDIFVSHSIPVYSNTICSSSISLSKWNDIVMVLNGEWKQREHIPASVAENEYISCIHQSPIMIRKGIEFSKGKEGYSYSKENLSYLAHSYHFYPTSSEETIESICHYNAMVCEEKELESIATIWLLLENLASIVATQKNEEESRTRSHSIVSPRLPRSRNNSVSSAHHSNSIGDYIPRSNSFVDITQQSDFCNSFVHLSLQNDLHFLYDLVREGDILNAIAIACVFWKYFRTDEHSITELQKWLYSFMDILSSEEMYEEIILIRNIASTIGIPFKEDYYPNITFQTATRQDQADFRLSPLFFANGARYLPTYPHSPEGSYESERECKSCSSKNHYHSGKGGKKDADGSKRRGNDLVVKMGKSKDSNVNSFCSVCRAKNQGLVAMCLRCGHGGHLKHIQEWFGNEGNRDKHCAIASCKCHCVFA